MIARASQWSAGEVAAAVGGSLRGDGHLALAGISTDTRDPLANHLFVALRGERYDAHELLGKAIEGGARALLVEREALRKLNASLDASRAAIIEVDDTLRALGDLARAHRRRLATPVLALTGSNGKTTTKEILAAVLSRSHRVLKTEGNLNNLVGLPMTLLGLEAQHQLAVIEMGMNTPGEIARYTEIAEPRVGMVINVGPAHIGKLGSMEAIANAKGELFGGLAADALAVVNADDPEVVRVANEAGLAPGRVRRFGTKPDVAVRLVSAAPRPEGGQTLEVLVDGRTLTVELPLDGAHNAMNTTAAIAAATAPVDGIHVSDDDVLSGVARVGRVAGRFVAEHIGPYVIIDDCYNANSASMKAAIETVAARVRRDGGRMVALLGEMRELGVYAESEHREVGRALVEHGAKMVAAFGREAAAYADVAAAAGLDAAHEEDDAEKLFDWFWPRLSRGDVLLIKGSRGMRMERFIEMIRRRAG